MESNGPALWTEGHPGVNVVAFFLAGAAYGAVWHRISTFRKSRPAVDWRSALDIEMHGASSASPAWRQQDSGRLVSMPPLSIFAYSIGMY